MWKFKKDLLLFMKPTSWFLKTKKFYLLRAHWNAAGRSPAQGCWLGGDNYSCFNCFCILLDLGYFLLLLLWKFTLREILHCQWLFGGKRGQKPSLIYVLLLEQLDGSSQRPLFPHFSFPVLCNTDYLIFLYWHQWQLHITLEWVFTVCSGIEGQSDMMCLGTWSICVVIFMEKLNTIAVISW